MTKSLKIVLTAMAGLSVATIGGVVALLTHGTAVSWGGEVLKFLFSVLQVQLVGVVFWLLQEEYKRYKAESDAKRKYLEETVQRVRAAYVGVKRVRRLLKASAAGRSLNDSDAFKLGEILMGPQLELETLKWETKSAAHRTLMSPNAERVPDELAAMEEYANALSKALMRAPPGEALRSKAVIDTTGPYAGSEFATKFAEPYDRVVQALMFDRAQ